MENWRERQKNFRDFYILGKHLEIISTYRVDKNQIVT